MKFSEQEKESLNDSLSIKESQENAFLPVLKNFNFVNLWIGQIFSQLADKVYLVLMIAIITNFFHNEGETISTWVSAVMIAFTIPAILFGSLAGVYVDRWYKKAVLILSNLGRGALVFLIPFVLINDNTNGIWLNFPIKFWILLVLTFLVSTLTQFFAPAEQSFLPLIVKKRNLLAANSIYTTTMMAMVIFGFAIGNPLLDLVANWGNRFSFEHSRELLVGGGYTVAGLVLILVKSKEKDKDRQMEVNHPWQDIKEGINYLRQNERVRNALFQLVILFSIFAALAVLAVSLADKIPQLEAEEFGYLLASAGFGIAVGATFVTQQGDYFSHGKLSFYGSIGMAGALIGLSFSTGSLILALLMTVLVGCFAALIGVPMQTTIQSETPPAMRGKVFGLQNNAVNIALSLPLALAGIAESVWGLPTVLFILALFSLGSGVLSSRV